MYDDASYYYSFNSSAQAPEEKTQKHKRKQSLLDKPNVSPALQPALMPSDVPYRKNLKLTPVD